MSYIRHTVFTLLFYPSPEIKLHIALMLGLAFVFLLSAGVFHAFPADSANDKNYLVRFAKYGSGRSLDRIGGGHLNGRSLDAIGGGHLMGRSIEATSLNEQVDNDNLISRALNQIKGGYLNDRSLDSIGGGHLMGRSLDRIGGGHLNGRDTDNMLQDSNLDGDDAFY